MVKSTVKIKLPDGTTAHIRITANPIAGRPATRQDLLYALDQQPDQQPAVRPGHSIHEKECPRSDPNPLKDPPCECKRTSQ